LIDTRLGTKTFVVIIDGNCEGALSVVLADDVLVERSGDLCGLEEIEAVAGWSTLRFGGFGTL
jgi:hypothetical protein